MIVRHARKASEKQGAKAVFYCLENETDQIYVKLKEAKRKYKELKIYYYFEKERIMKEQE